jgi:hypothetical protein
MKWRTKLHPGICQVTLCVARDGVFTVHCDITVAKESCTTAWAEEAITIPVSPSNITCHLKRLLVSDQGSNITSMVQEGSS